MADPFISEIRMYGFAYPPRDWAQCDGQVLAINSNQALFSLIGAAFGGNGTSDFALPDMRGKTAVSFGEYVGPEANLEIDMGMEAGVENVTLTTSEMAQHTHSVRGTTTQGNTKLFPNTIFATAIDNRAASPTAMYGPETNLTSLNAQSVTSIGSGGGHSNIQPSIVVNFCIALTGTFPSRN